MLIKFIKYIIEVQIKATFDLHVKALEIISPIACEAEDVRNTLDGMLDDDDPILEVMRRVDIELMSVVNAIDEELKSGIPVDTVI